MGRCCQAKMWVFRCGKCEATGCAHNTVLCPGCKVCDDNFDADFCPTPLYTIITIPYHSYAMQLYRPHLQIKDQNGIWG